MKKWGLKDFRPTGQIEGKRGELVWLDDWAIVGEIFKWSKINESYKGEGSVDSHDANVMIEQNS